MSGAHELAGHNSRPITRKEKKVDRAVQIQHIAIPAPGKTWDPRPTAIGLGMYLPGCLRVRKRFLECWRFAGSFQCVTQVAIAPSCQAPGVRMH